MPCICLPGNAAGVDPVVQRVSRVLSGAAARHQRGVWGKQREAQAARKPGRPAPLWKAQFIGTCRPTASHGAAPAPRRPPASQRCWWRRSCAYVAIMVWWQGGSGRTTGIHVAHAVVVMAHAWTSSAVLHGPLQTSMCRQVTCVQQSFVCLVCEQVAAVDACFKTLLAFRTFPPAAQVA